VVAPLAVDVQEISAQTFVLKTAVIDQGFRAKIIWLNVCFQSVQSEAGKS
jgi:hypothetical protein